MSKRVKALDSRAENAAVQGVRVPLNSLQFAFSANFRVPLYDCPLCMLL